MIIKKPNTVKNIAILISFCFVVTIKEIISMIIDDPKITHAIYFIVVNKSYKEVSILPCFPTTITACITANVIQINTDNIPKISVEITRGFTFFLDSLLIVLSLVLTSSVVLITVVLP